MDHLQDEMTKRERTRGRRVDLQKCSQRGEKCSVWRCRHSNEHDDLGQLSSTVTSVGSSTRRSPAPKKRKAVIRVESEETQDDVR